MDIIEAVWERFPAEWRVWLVIGAAVLMGVEALATGVTMSARAKRLTAFGLGPLLGMALYALSQVDVPLHGEFAPEGHADTLAHVGGCALMGLAGTLAAALAHDAGGGAALKWASERLIGKSSAAPAGGTS